MLEQLLKKPESYRRKLAFLTTAILGIIIFSIWLIITQYNVKQAFSNKQPQKTATEQFRENLPSLQNINQTVTTELVK